jgi:hypothetical protein
MVGMTSVASRATATSAIAARERCRWVVVTITPWVIINLTVYANYPKAMARRRVKPVWLLRSTRESKSVHT